VLAKHDSVIEKYVANHPFKAQDLIYPTNMMVIDDMLSTASMTPKAMITSDTPGEFESTRAGYIELGRAMDEKLRIQLLLESLPSQKIAMIVTIAVFAGYASLFSLQHYVKVFFQIPDDNSSSSHQFSYAITIQYISNLVFRLGQNVILAPFTPRQRCVFGLLSMAISMSILGIGIFTLQIRSLLLLATAYAFGGCAVGVFETNYSVVLAALGNRTKIYGISGIPLGIFLVIVPGFIAVGMGMDVRWIYSSVVAMIGSGVLILYRIINYPNVEDLISSSDVSPRSPNSPGVNWETVPVEKKSWIIPVTSIGIVFAINMLFVSAFSPGVLLYLMNSEYVESPVMRIRTGIFFAIFSSFGFIGDVISRRIVYARNPEFHPIWYLVFTLVGVSIIISMIPEIAPLGTFLVFFANGSIYAQSCRLLDMQLGPEISVLGNSLFFFMGDCGSVIGAVAIPFIRDILAAGGPILG